MVHKLVVITLGFFASCWDENNMNVTEVIMIWCVYGVVELSLGGPRDPGRSFPTQSVGVNITF